MPDSLDILHIITKPVVSLPFLQDWLAFLSQEQRLRVHLFYSPQALKDLAVDNVTDAFDSVSLHRIENISPYPALTQSAVFLADYLDLRYLSKVVNPSLIHTHDTASLLVARYFFPTHTRLHSWWLEDRIAHRFWRLTVERLAQYRTWECLEEADENAAPVLGHTQFPLPSPLTLEERYERGKSFATMREIYRSILRATDLPLTRS